MLISQLNSDIRTSSRRLVTIYPFYSVDSNMSSQILLAQPFSNIMSSTVGLQHLIKHRNTHTNTHMEVIMKMIDELLNLIALSTCLKFEMCDHGKF